LRSFGALVIIKKMPAIRKTTPYKRTTSRKSYASIPGKRLMPMRTTMYKINRPVIKYDNTYYMKVERLVQFVTDVNGNGWHYMYAYGD